jgi:hypothetical protein
MDHNGFSDLIAWCKAELERKKKLLRWLETGRVRISESDGHSMVDVTEALKEQHRTDIADLERLIPR